MRLLRRQKLPEPVGRRRPASRSGQGSESRRTPAFSYYSQRSQDISNIGRQDQISAAASRQNPPAASGFGRHPVMFGCLAGIGLVVGLYLLTLDYKPKVILVQDVATEYFLQEPDTYQQAAQQSLSKSVFNKNKLTIDIAATRLDLLRNYPEIKNVSIVLPVFGHQPQVYIEPYKPSFILTTTSSNAFLLDATGRALATTSHITNVEKLGVPTLQDRTGIDVKQGSRALPSTTVGFAQVVMAALKAENVTVSSLVLPVAANELDVFIAGTPYFVRFNLQGDALQQAGTYLATRQRLAADRITPGQYIDVRVPERAYYK